MRISVSISCICFNDCWVHKTLKRPDMRHFKVAGSERVVFQYDQFPTHLDRLGILNSYYCNICFFHMLESKVNSRLLNTQDVTKHEFPGCSSAHRVCSSAGLSTLQNIAVPTILSTQSWDTVFGDFPSALTSCFIVVLIFYDFLIYFSMFCMILVYRVYCSVKLLKKLKLHWN